MNFKKLDNKTIAQIGDRCEYAYNKCRPYFTNTRTAIDVGSKAGAFATHICKEFDSVKMFDMRPKTQWRFLDKKKCELFECALGNKIGTVEHSGALTNVVVKGIPITKSPLKTLDSFNFKNVDFIKIDVEGDEVPVLQGADLTLKTHKPLIVVEQNHCTEKYNKGKYGDALRWLQDHNYKIIDHDGMDDWILQHE